MREFRILPQSSTGKGHFVLSEIINLLFVPIISLYIVFRQKGWPQRFSPELIMRWCIFASANMLITKAIFKSINVFYPVVMDLAGVKYTFVAAAVAVLLPYMIDFMKKYVSIRVEIKGNEKGSEV